MAWKKEILGALDNGAQVSKYTLTNENGVSAAFTDLGGTWMEMKTPDKDGNFKDVLLGYDTVEGLLTKSGHLGEIVGRNANRIGGAAFTLNGVTYALAINSGTKNNLHSGPDFYRSRLWDAAVGEDELGTKITFSLFSPDGDQNYPGNADIAVSYTLTPDNSVKIDYRMTADEDTIANFTNHAYFNLAGHDAGSVLRQQAWIDADRFTVTDDESIPTGELASVKGTPMDFTELKTIGRDIDADYEPLRQAGGYDHNWALNHKKGELALAARAVDPESGRVMEVYTDLPGVQFYTANGLKGQIGKDGAHYEPRCGYCFETQYFPDAINKPQFDSPVVKAGDEYRTTTVYHFTTE
ncbi:MAG: aldose epimerase family protein [Eubacteriales bacterium]|nr:aldose epimerase family protein [Eubacteriales bacterium]